MKLIKSIVISIVTLAGMTSCFQAERSVVPTSEGGIESAIVVLRDSLILNRNTGITFYKKIPFTGTGRSYFYDGQLETEVKYVMGKRNGLMKQWFEDGLLSFESQYTAGKKDGDTKSWWRNGNIRSHSHFEMGIAQGQQHQWYRSGAKFKTRILANGKEEGMQKSWRENGKLYNNYEAKNGRIFGLKRANLCYQLSDEEMSDERIK